MCLARAARDGSQTGRPSLRQHNKLNRHANKNRFWKGAGCVLCLVAVLTTLGGHWLVLQSYAWARMIRDYSRHDSLISAIAKTFDGKHPCGLCLTIQQDRQQENAENKSLPCTTSDKTPELLCDMRRTAAPLPPDAATKAVPTVVGWHNDFIDSPPTPPPRAA
jgi:hypothetical protein